MLKKALKPDTNSFSCIEMMLVGAKKRRMMAQSAIRALDGGKKSSTNVIMLK